MQGRHTTTILGGEINVVLVALNDLADGFVEEAVQWCPTVFVFPASVRTTRKQQACTFVIPGVP
jgi:hypothetical protein